MRDGDSIVWGLRLRMEKWDRGFESWVSRVVGSCSGGWEGAGFGEVGEVVVAELRYWDVSYGRVSVTYLEGRILKGYDWKKAV